jgi:hypothetical protein
MGKVVTTFVNPTFDIEEATLVLCNVDSMQGLTFSTFPVRSNVAQVDLDKAAQIEWWLTGIVLRRTADANLMPFTFCSFSQQITDAAIAMGQWTVDLTKHKEIIFRLRGNPQPSQPAMFNLSKPDRYCPLTPYSHATFDLSPNDLGESAVLAEPGHYFVSAICNGKSVMACFAVSSTDTEQTILDFEL